ncbi:MAG: DUF1573 domain-containing protein [Flavobacteriales bacterium]|jgi:hypothetical protein|nr:DUF1573 domain-containing protein [Flavobacteriales bacterium]
MYLWSLTLLLPLLIVTAHPAEQGPRIRFAQEVYDYGTIAFASDGRCSFTFTNTGDAPLIIHQFRSSCGCLVPYWDQEPVAPGASGRVSLRYDTRTLGPFRKTAMLTTNDPQRPQIVLSITGEVIPAERWADPAPTPR